jgi:uncharacterized protein YjiS (DUF1127 family)
MMSMMSRAATEPQSTGSFAAMTRWIARLARTLMLHWYRRAAVKSLSELDDRALRDIGLQRCHIEQAVRGEVRRRLS